MLCVGPWEAYEDFPVGIETGRLDDCGLRRGIMSIVHIYTTGSGLYRSLLCHKCLLSIYHASSRCPMHLQENASTTPFALQGSQSQEVCPHILNSTPSQNLPSELSVHLFPFPHTLSFALVNSNTNQTPLQHSLPINPRVHLPKQPCPISARRFQQLRLAARMIRRIRRDIINLASQHRPRIFAFPSSHLFQ